MFLMVKINTYFRFLRMLRQYDEINLFQSFHVIAKQKVWFFSLIPMQLNLRLFHSPLMEFLSPLALFLSPLALFLCSLMEFLSPLSLFLSSLTLFLSSLMEFLSPLTLFLSSLIEFHPSLLRIRLIILRGCLLTIKTLRLFGGGRRGQRSRPLVFRCAALLW